MCNTFDSAFNGMSQCAVNVYIIDIQFYNCTNVFSFLEIRKDHARIPNLF